MITVRFPSGFSVQYNDLHAAAWGRDGSVQLYASVEERDSGWGWKVTVPNGALVEFVTPCQTYNAVRDEITETVRNLVQSEFKTIHRQIRAVEDYTPEQIEEYRKIIEFIVANGRAE